MANSLLEQLRDAPSLLDRQEVIDECHRTGRDLCIQDTSLAGFDLSGLWLTPIRMAGIDFRGCVCRHATFPPLIDCSFDGVDARDSMFPRLTRCRFREASLAGACFGVRMIECDFSGSDLRSGGLRQMPTQQGSPPECRDNIFSATDMRGFDAAGGHLVGMTFSGARLAGARLSRADLCRADLRDADLEGANLVGAKLQGVNLHHAKLERCVVGRSGPQDLEAAGCAVPANLTLVTRSPGPAQRALENELASLTECELRWDFVRNACPRRESVILWKENGGPFKAGATRRRCVIRTYPSDDSTSLASIIEELLADYADWHVELQSHQIDAGGLAKDFLRGLLAELFFTE